MPRSANNGAAGPHVLLVSVQLVNDKREIEHGSSSLHTQEGKYISRRRNALAVPDSADVKAGIKRNDVIEQFNGVPIESGPQLLQLVAALKPGAEVKVVVSRSGERQTLTVTLGKRPSEREITPGKD